MNRTREKQSFLDEMNNESSSLLKQKPSKRYVTVCSCFGVFKGFRMRRPVFITSLAVVIILLLLIGILVVVYVVIPAIIRSTIARAQLKFNSINIEDIQISSFRLQAELVLSRTGVISASIFAPLTINVNDVGEVTNNQTIEISGSSNATLVPINSPFIIKNIRAFQNFSHSLIFDQNVIWHLTASATVRPLGSFMPSYSNIPFDKIVTLDALNGLSNVTVDSVSFNRSDDHQIYADIVINIKNPSIFTVDLGQLQFSLEYNNQYIGYVRSTSDQVVLVPQENKIPFSGELQSNSTEAYNSLLVVIQNFLTNGKSDVRVLAGPDATSYPLLATAMNGLSLNVEMPPFDKAVIRDLVFESISLIPSIDDNSVSLSAIIVIKINSPLGNRSPLTIQTMDMNAFINYNNSNVGLLTVSQIPVQQIDATTYRTEFSNRSLILIGTGINYEHFSKDFINADKTNPIQFRIIGKASIVGGFALGPLSISNISVSNDVSLAGLNGLSEVIVHGISIEGEEQQGLRLSIDATIENPGIAVVQLRNFTFQLLEAENGTTLGEIPVGDLAVLPGTNNVQLYGSIAPKNATDLPVFSGFFSAYLNGKTQRVRLFHEQSSLNNATAMDLTVSGLKIEADLFGITPRLIQHIDVLNFGIYFDPDNPNHVYVSGSFQTLFVLPSNIEMNFKVLSVSIDYFVCSNDGVKFGQVSLREVPVEHNQTTNEILIKFNQEKLNVIDSNTFQKFAADLVLTKSVSLIIEGSVAAVSQLRIGILTLTEIPLNQTITLVGYDQFNGGLLSIKKIDILGSLSDDQLMMTITTNINNPSVVNILSGGRLSLDLVDLNNSTLLGLINIDPFYLKSLDEITTAEAEGIFTMNDENKNTAREFISRMVSGLENNVRLTGKLSDNSTGTSVPLLELAVSGLRIETAVPGLSGDGSLVQEIILKKLKVNELVAIGLGFLKTIKTRIRLINPFNTTLVIHKMKVRADNSPIVDEKEQVGVVDASTEFFINPYSELITSYVEVDLTAELSTLVGLLVPLYSGQAHLSLSGTVDVTMGDGFSLVQLPITIENVKTDQEKPETEGE